MTVNQFFQIHLMKVLTTAMTRQSQRHRTTWMSNQFNQHTMQHLQKETPKLVLTPTQRQIQRMAVTIQIKRRMNTFLSMFCASMEMISSLDLGDPLLDMVMTTQEAFSSGLMLYQMLL